MKDRPADAALRIAGRAIGAAIIVGAIAASAFVYVELYRHPRTDDAYVRANVVGIAAHVGGPIVALPIVDNQSVREGDLLFVVDPRPYELELERARAELLVTDKEIEGYARSIEAAAALVREREADARYAADYLSRVEPLLERRFVTPDQVEDARTRKRAAEALAARSRHERDRAIAELADYEDGNARRRAALARVRDAELDVGYCYVRAPFDGYVTNLNIAVGQYANVGREVIALVDNRRWYVLANFKETYLEDIVPGDRAEVYLLAYPGTPFSGVVQGIGWALHQENGATVGVLPQVDPNLDWVRLAQRFPVRIALDPPDPARPYRMGATAIVTIRGGRERPPDAPAEAPETGPDLSVSSGARP
jgi:multidrug resistance efflux pump